MTDETPFRQSCQAFLDGPGIHAEHVPMRRACRIRTALTRVTLTAVTALSSCGGNSTTSTSSPTPGPISDETSLFVLGSMALDAPDCIAKPSASAALLSQGTLDLAFQSTYTSFLLVGNQLARAGMAETERVSLRGAEITLTAADGTVIASYSSVGTGFLDAAAASASYGAIAVNVIPSELALTEPVQMAQLLLAKIRVLGEALNGTSLTSIETTLPIRVCKGCLVQYPASAADATSPPGSPYRCRTAGGEPNAPPVPCLLGQDVPFSCEVCAADLDLCRDPSLNPAHH